MNMRDYYRTHLSDYLDEHGDVAPPWAQFPDYGRHTIGWRMGMGESWLCAWAVFLEQMGDDYDDRLAYLRRHLPAPMPWAGEVYRVLHPSEPHELHCDEATRARRINEVLELGLCCGCLDD